VSVSRTTPVSASRQYSLIDATTARDRQAFFEP
jgi:hypothetical protein